MFLVPNALFKQAFVSFATHPYRFFTWEVVEICLHPLPDEFRCRLREPANQLAPPMEGPRLLPHSLGWEDQAEFSHLNTLATGTSNLDPAPVAIQKCCESSVAAEQKLGSVLAEHQLTGSVELAEGEFDAFGGGYAGSSGHGGIYKSRPWLLRS